jgi:hypothetical protein
MWDRPNGMPVMEWLSGGPVTSTLAPTGLITSQHERSVNARTYCKGPFLESRSNFTS